MPLDPDLHNAFVSTTYSIKGLASLKIGEPVPDEIQAWMRAYQSEAVSILGAENPNGKRISETENEQRHIELLKELTQRNLNWFPATGHTDDWRERHVMIVGLSRDEVLDLKQRYDQAAALYAEDGGMLEMI